MGKKTDLNKDFCDFIKEKNQDFSDYSNIIDSTAIFLENKGVTLDEIKAHITKKIRQKQSEKMPKDLPVFIFSNKKLSSFESICKYLKEEKQLKFSEIANIVNRDQRTIWVTYSNSLKKFSGRVIPAKDDSSTDSATDTTSKTSADYRIPINLISRRDMSVLESISYYLHLHYKLPFHKIATLMNLDDRTIWTTFHRATLKLRGKNE